jgi:hypothetical protein
MARIMIQKESGFAQFILIIIVVVVLVMAGGGFWYYKQSTAPIEYSAVSRPCMSSEFVKGYTENLDTDWSGKDSCDLDLEYNLDYKQGDKYATLSLHSSFPPIITGTLRPLNSPRQSEQPQSKTCSTSKDVRDNEKGFLPGDVVDERETTWGGKSAYRVITKYSDNNYITVYVCLGSKTYNLGGSPVHALYVTGFYSDDFQKEVVDHALANWHWK